jgi:hypothetical protein
LYLWRLRPLLLSYLPYYLICIYGVYLRYYFKLPCCVKHCCYLYYLFCLYCYFLAPYGISSLRVMASPLLIMGVSLPAGYGPLYGLWASLPVGLRVTGLSLRGLLASVFAGYWPLFSRVAGLSLCGLWASLPCGLWAFFLRVMGVSTGYGRLYGLRAFLRVMGLSMGYGPLYGLWASLPCGLWASLSTGYWPLSLRACGLWASLPCGLWAFSLRVVGVSTGCWRLYGLLVLLSLRTTVADLPVPQL